MIHHMEAVPGTALRSMHCLEGCPILGPFRTPWLLLGQLSLLNEKRARNERSVNNNIITYFNSNKSSISLFFHLHCVESASFLTDALSRLADDSAPVKQLRGKLRKDARNSPTDVSLLLESKARSKAKASS